jgi:hypothetical protein
MAGIGIAASPEPASGATPRHLAWTVLGAVTIAVWPAFAARRASPRPLILSVCGSAAVTAIFVALLGWLLAETRDGSVLGLAERLTTSIQTCWPFIIAVALRRTRRPRPGLAIGGSGRVRTRHGAPNNNLIINKVMTPAPGSLRSSSASAAASRHRLRGQRGQQGGRVVAAAVHDTVDEQGRGAEHLARGQAAGHIPADPAGHRSAGPVPVEDRHVQAELVGVSAQVPVFECLLPAEQQLVHVPEPALQRSSLGRSGRGEGVRVDAAQREVPEREPRVPVEPLFDLLDGMERLP